MKDNAASDCACQYSVLHNRKTAGTALKYVVEQQKQRTPEMNVLCFGHAVTFPRLVKEYPNSKAIFFVRDPISRFISGFYSRLRQGMPRYYFQWSSGEKKAFKRFATPNQLAETLSAKNFFKRRSAVLAMKSIGHVRHTYLEFLGPLAFLEQEKERIAYIGNQTEFTVDLCNLRVLLKLDEDISPPDDDFNAHRNPGDIDKHLSETALLNLQTWYKQDFEIYQWCLQRREYLIQQLPNTATPNIATPSRDR